MAFPSEKAAQQLSCEPCEAAPLIPCTPGAPLAADGAQVKRMLEVIETEILPRTRVNVAEGNKVFGAAILRDTVGMETVIADSNHEMQCPLFHGEIWTIQQWSAMPAEQRPAASECIFLCTHEPCCLCISGIVWSGFKKCFYLYPYETTKAQGIPHDLNIMYNLWQVPRYATCNSFCTTTGLLSQIDLAEEALKPELAATVERINEQYGELSKKYHTEKAANPSNNLAFN